MVVHSSMGRYIIKIYDQDRYNKRSDRCDISANSTIFSYTTKNNRAKLLVISPALKNPKMISHIRSIKRIRVNNITRIVEKELGKELAKESRRRRVIW